MMLNTMIEDEIDQSRTACAEGSVVLNHESFWLFNLKFVNTTFPGFGSELA